MGFYGDYEKAHQEAQKRIEAYRQAAALAPAVMKVIKSFDGKVYNCRLDKALREATNNGIMAYKQYQYVEIYGYFNNGHIILARFKPEDLKNKRINADDLIKQVRENRERILKEAYELEIYSPQAEQIRDYIRATIDRLETYCRSLPDDIRHIYGIPYCIRCD